MLRLRTARHVAAVARDRKYLVARYGPDCPGSASQVNRLLATLDEVAAKVSRAFVANRTPLRPAVAASAAVPPS